jgi:hypothetical protein
MAAPLRVLLVFSVAATTKVEGDVTSMAGPPWGCWPKSDSSHHRS